MKTALHANDGIVHLLGQVTVLRGKLKRERF